MGWKSCHGHHCTPDSGLWIGDRVLEMLHCLIECVLDRFVIVKRIVVLGIAFYVIAMIEAQVHVKTVGQIIFVQGQSDGE